MRKILRKIVCLAMAFVVGLVSYGCTMFVDKNAWDTRADIYEYLNSNYPDISFTVSEKYKSSLIGRKWYATSEDYPGLTFEIENHIASDGVTPFPNFKRTSHTDNIYEQLFESYRNTFMDSVEETYGTGAYDFWDFSEERLRRLKLVFSLNHINQLDIAKQMALDFEEGFIAYTRGMKPAGINLYVDIEYADSRYIADRDGILERIDDLDATTYAETIEEKFEWTQDSLLRYAAVNYVNAAGVTDDMRRTYIEQLKTNTDDSGLIQYEIIENGNHVPFLAKKDFQADTLLFTRGSAYELFQQLGLEVHHADAYRHCFTVVGIDGKAYEFLETYDFEEEKAIDTEVDYTVDGTPHSFEHGYLSFEVDAELIQQISGVNIKK